MSHAVGGAKIEEWARFDLRHLGEPVLRVTQVRHDDQDRPVRLERIVMVVDRVPGLTSGEDGIPDITELVQRHGLDLARVAERVSIVPATGDVALHLGVARGIEVVKMERVVETTDGVPLEWRVAYSVGRLASNPEPALPAAECTC